MMTNNEIVKELAEFRGEIMARLETMEKRQDNMASKIDDLSRIASFGKGAGWAVLKLGAAVAGFVAVATAIWTAIHR